jgi:hypothetical protein
MPATAYAGDNQMTATEHDRLDICQPDPCVLGQRHGHAFRRLPVRSVR